MKSTLWDYCKNKLISHTKCISCSWYIRHSITSLLSFNQSVWAHRKNVLIKSNFNSNIFNSNLFFFILYFYLAKGNCVQSNSKNLNTNWFPKWCSIIRKFMSQIPVYACNVKANHLFVFYKEDLIKASSGNN